MIIKAGYGKRLESQKKKEEKVIEKKATPKYNVVFKEEPKIEIPVIEEEEINLLDLLEE